MNAVPPLHQLLHHLTSLIIPQDPLHTIPTNHAAQSTPLNTPYYHHRHRPPLFPNEPLILFLSIFFCRFVTQTGSLTGCSHSIHHAKFEFGLRTCISIVLGCMAYSGMEYSLICGVHLWSHVAPWVVGRCCRILLDGRNDGKVINDDTKTNTKKETETTSWTSLATVCLAVILTFPISLYTCRYLSSPSFLSLLPTILPSSLKEAIYYMFPIHEMTESYNIISAFYTTPQQTKVLHDMLKHLLFVTVHIQFGLGHIGIDFLTSEQKRKNMLIRMDVDNPPPVAAAAASVENGNGNDGKKDNDKEKRDTDKKEEVTNNNNNTNATTPLFDPSRKFRRSAPTFILLTVLPYMFQIILFGNVNNFSFMYVRNQIHNSVRIDELFHHVSYILFVAWLGCLLLFLIFHDVILHHTCSTSNNNITHKIIYHSGFTFRSISQRRCHQSRRLRLIHGQSCQYCV